jgi:hypothetical protein
MLLYKIMEVNKGESRAGPSTISSEKHYSFYEFCLKENFIVTSDSVVTSNSVTSNSVASDIEKKISISNCDTQITVDEPMLKWLGYTGELKNQNTRFKKLIYSAKVIPYKPVTSGSTTFLSLTPSNLLRAIMKMKTGRADYVREFLQNMFFMQGRYAEYCEKKIKIERNHVTLLHLLKEN